MANDELIRRDVLQTLAALPFMALLTQASRAHAQVGVSPVKVDTQGLVAKIKFEAPLEGFLKEINGNSRVPDFVYEAKRKIGMFCMSCRSTMNFVRE